MKLCILLCFLLMWLCIVESRITEGEEGGETAIGAEGEGGEVAKGAEGGRAEKGTEGEKGGEGKEEEEEEEHESRELDRTPTWAVGLVSSVIILISIFWEKVLNGLGGWFLKKNKSALYGALERVKDELMVLGFISLLLTFSQSYVSKICIPVKTADTMQPCSENETDSDSTGMESMEYEPNPCKRGHVPLMSKHGLHQLHILIFFLAVFHLLYSGVTMLLGRSKIRGWKVWEAETKTDHDNEFSRGVDSSRFRLTHETSFVRAHASSNWTRIPIFFYIGCFFRQFHRSVTKADYLTLRNGFISAHLAPGSKFNFQKYIKRSLEDDFKVVVGVSPVLWLSFVLFLTINIDGWQTLYWTALIPVTTILVIGTKLQAILTKMALDIIDRQSVVQGIPLVQGSDKYFWFGWPQLVLYLIQFALFQNALQTIYLFWIWYSFGTRSCFHDANLEFAIAKAVLGVGLLVLCSYMTLPLYSLVTQMGSTMKKAIFDEQTAKALKKWHKTARKKLGEGKASTHGTSGVKTLSSSHCRSSSCDGKEACSFELVDLSNPSTSETNLATAEGCGERTIQISPRGLEEATTKEAPSLL